MTDNEFGVVLAVGPEGVQGGALEFAAAEAVQRGTGVELVHVVRSLVHANSGQVDALDDKLVAVARGVLTDASDRIAPLLFDKVPLRAEVLAGPVPATLVARAVASEMVVLERRASDQLERLLTMSVSTRVAAHAKAPVVVVPQGWVPSGTDLPVVAGVDQPSEAVGQVEAAAAYAAASGRALRVLHAMWLAQPYQDTFFVNHTRQQWTHDADVSLRLALERLDAPGTTITRDVRWVRPAEALVDATRRSAVLVLSRRPDHGSFGAHLGPITRTVLRHAECPVMVVDRT